MPLLLPRAGGHICPTPCQRGKRRPAAAQWPSGGTGRRARRAGRDNAAVSRPDDLQPADAHAPYFTIAPDNFGSVAFWAALNRLSTGCHDHQRFLVADAEHLHRYRWNCAPCEAILAVIDVPAAEARRHEQR